MDCIVILGWMVIGGIIAVIIGGQDATINT